MSVFSTNKGLGRVSQQICQLQNDIDDLQRGARKLDLEFTELYDKVRYQLARMAKREAVARKNDDEPPEELQNDLPFPDADPISRSILLRRGGVGSKQ